MQSKFTDTLTHLTYLGLALAGFLLGLYAFASLTRFDWGGVLMAIPAIALFRLFLEYDRTHPSPPDPYAYVRPSAEEDQAQRERGRAWTAAHPWARFIGPLVVLGLPALWIGAALFWPR
jgi:hypothetical protein